MALILFTGLGICLIHTFSRGGIVSLGCGLLPLLWMAPRPWSRKMIIAVAAAVWIIVGASIFLQADSRYMQGIVKEDRSITHRLEIWEKAPQMMVDAPTGWGLGQSGTAYVRWYQQMEGNEGFVSLINSHLTWLVEIGWGWRFLYLYGWLTVLSLCWPNSELPWFSVPLGIWLAFGTASIFTHVAESPWLWILPGASFVIVLGVRIRRHVWLSLSVWPAIAGVSAVSLLLVYWIGSSHQELKIRGSSHEVIIGNGKPEIWIVINPVIMGERYGKVIRRYFQTSGKTTSLGIVSKLEDLPEGGDFTVVVAGSVQNADFINLRQRTKLILLNPTFTPSEIEFNKSKSVSVYLGEFSQSPAFYAWTDLGVVKNIEGKGDFLPNWPELILN